MDRVEVRCALDLEPVSVNDLGGLERGDRLWPVSATDRDGGEQLEVVLRLWVGDREVRVDDDPVAPWCGEHDGLGDLPVGGDVAVVVLDVAVVAADDDSDQRRRVARSIPGNW